MKESDLINLIRIKVSAAGARIFRNNVGQYTAPSGAIIRYGVVNPGGSDLIGWTPRLITPDDIGKTLAVFTAIEVKTGRLKPTPDQLNFIDQVKKAGGLAGVSYSVEDAIRIIKGETV